LWIIIHGAHDSYTSRSFFRIYTSVLLYIFFQWQLCIRLIVHMKICFWKPLARNKICSIYTIYLIVHLKICSWKPLARNIRCLAGFGRPMKESKLWIRFARIFVADFLLT
jgi:hypothetical protein